MLQRERQDIKLRRMEHKSQRPGVANFNNYWTYGEINRHLTQLTLLYGDLCHTETLGFSYEGRAMRALKIGSFDGTKPIVFFEAGVHARVTKTIFHFMFFEVLLSSLIFEILNY